MIRSFPLAKRKYIVSFYNCEYRVFRTHPQYLFCGRGTYHFSARRFGTSMVLPDIIIPSVVPTDRSDRLPPAIEGVNSPNFPLINEELAQVLESMDGFYCQFPSFIEGRQIYAGDQNYSLIVAIKPAVGSDWWEWIDYWEIWGREASSRVNLIQPRFWGRD